MRLLFRRLLAKLLLLSRIKNSNKSFGARASYHPPKSLHNGRGDVLSFSLLKRGQGGCNSFQKMMILI